MIFKFLTGSGILVVCAAFLIYIASTPVSLPDAVLSNLGSKDIATSLEDSKSSLRIVSWNIAYGYGKGSEAYTYRFENRDRIPIGIRRITAVLRRLNADVVMLQEIDFDARRSNHENQLQRLSESLELPYYAAVAAWNKRYIPYPSWPLQAHLGPLVSGGAVLSKRPICRTDSQLFKPDAPLSFLTRLFYLDRYAQVVRLCDFPDIALVNVHLEDSNESINAAQFAATLQVDRESASALVVAGDFNARAAIHLAAVAAANLTVHPDGAPTTYWPSQASIDYFLVRGAKILESRAHADAGEVSDHYPISLDIALD